MIGISTRWKQNICGATDLFLHDQYVGDKLDYVVHIPKTESRWEIKDFMDFIKNPKSTVGMQNGQTIHFIQRIKSGSPLTKMLL
jgi:uncharacterized protein YfdQ (DUF2303 family)